MQIPDRAHYLQISKLSDLFNNDVLACSHKAPFVVNLRELVISSNHPIICSLAKGPFACYPMLCLIPPYFPFLVLIWNKILLFNSFLY